MDGTGAGALFMSAEYAVKAVIVEHHGFLPPSFKTHHRIVNLSHLIGLWWQLPPDLRAHLADIAPLDPNVRYSRETAYETLASSSSNAEWQQRLTTAPRFIEYIERDVIGNPTTRGKLTYYQRRGSHLAARCAALVLKTAASGGRQPNHYGVEGVAVSNRSQ